MTNQQLSHKSGRLCRSHNNTGKSTESPVRAKDLCVSVEDMKDQVFTYSKTMLDTYIMSAKKFLDFMWSKFGPSESNFLQQGKVIVRRAKKLCHLEKKEDFKRLNFLEQEDWRIQKKSYNLKSEKIIDNLGQAWQYLWNQCTLILKTCVKLQVKFKTAKKDKNTTNL